MHTMVVGGLCHALDVALLLLVMMHGLHLRVMVRRRVRVVLLLLLLVHHHQQ